MAHASLAPSSSSIWKKCAQSAHIKAGLKATGALDSIPVPDEQQEAMSKGTIAHKLAERYVQDPKNDPPGQYVGQSMTVEGEGTFEIEPWMAEAAAGFADYVNSRVLELEMLQGWEVECLIEELVDITGALMRDDRDRLTSWGTADCILKVRDPEDHRLTFVEVVDLKTGHFPVYPSTSDQLRLYLLGAIGRVTDFTYPEARLSVIQPSDGGLKTYDLSAETVLALADENYHALEAVNQPGAKFNNGQHCTICPVRHVCPLAIVAAEKLDGLHDKADLGTAEPLELSELATMADRARPFVNSIFTYVHNELANGTEVPGFKLVEKKTHRVWTSGAEDELVKELGEGRVYQQKLLPPAQVEKMGEAGKYLAERLAEKPQPGLTVAASDDSRAGTSKVERAKNVFSKTDG